MNVYICLVVTCFTSACAGLLEENVICRNAGAGVKISAAPDQSGLSRAVLSRNKIFDGLGAGVKITKGATADLDKNEIFGNILSGINIPAGVLHRQKGQYICCTFYLPT